MTNHTTSTERAGIIQHLEEITRTLETEQFENPTRKRGELITDFRTELIALKLSKANR